MKYTACMLGFMVAMPLVSCGTNQLPEKLVDEFYEERDMASAPLEDYFSADHPRPKWLVATSSACWRGYVGTWEIRENALFLTWLHKEALSGKEDFWWRLDNAIPLERIFVGDEGPVRADWFSGVLRVLDGKRLTSMMFSPVRERDLFISVLRGEILGKRTVDNTLGGEWSWSDQSWQDLARKSRESLGSLEAMRDADLAEEDWLDGRQLSRQAKELKGNQTTFNVRGLFFGAKLWIPPTRLIIRAGHRENYDFARSGIHYNLDYVPNINVKAESRSRMVGTTVQVTAKFCENNRTLLVSKVYQLPSGESIQKRPKSNE